VNKENQHFVPKAFLKNFCISGKSEIYQSRFIEFNQKWVNPISKHTNSICYSEDIYDVGAEFAKKNDVPTDYVERNAFWYERGFMDELIKKIETETVHKSDIEKLPDFYLSMIARNPVFMSGFDPAKTENLLDEELAQLRQESEWVKKMAQLTTDEELNDWFEAIRSRFLTEQTQQKMYSSSLYKQHTGQSESYNEIKNKIQGYKVMIGRIREEGLFFITSDSPGFSMCQNGMIYSLKFKDDAFHYMPISSKIMVSLLHPIYSFNAPEFSIVDVSSETLKFINDGTIKASREYIYCENKEFLSGIVANRTSK
jgi:hypothetical protein